MDTVRPHLRYLRPFANLYLGSGLLYYAVTAADHAQYGCFADLRQYSKTIVFKVLHKFEYTVSS